MHARASVPDAQLIRDVRSGLGSSPRSLAPRWLYDEVGTELFERITRLPDYYLTEAERTLLAEHAREVSRVSGARTIVELGSGTADKTMTLLDAFNAGGQLRAFEPLDVSRDALGRAARRARVRFPGLDVRPHLADFSGSLPPAADAHPRLVAFLGSTIGNFYPAQRREFLNRLSASLRAGDSLLLGTDLVKSADRLVRAYDDSAGVTERFIRNILSVLNRQLGADFRDADFAYVPLWDDRNRRMDLRLRARRTHVVRVPGADLTVRFVAGEEIRVEISTKFVLDDVARELAEAGLRPTRLYANADFALALAMQPALAQEGAPVS